MSRFKTVVPLMVYLPPAELSALKQFAKGQRKPVSHIVRDGVQMRLAGDANPFNTGFNDGLKTAMEIAQKTRGAQMRFPSGRSFGQLVCEEIEQYMRTHTMPEDQGAQSE